MMRLYTYNIPRSRIKTITNNKPIAIINAEDIGFIDTEIKFDGTSSSDPDGDTFTHFWDFGDPNITYYDTSTESKTTYKYSAPGNYIVTLKIKDVAGAEGQTTLEIEISHYFSIAVSGHGRETDPSTYHDGDYYVDVRLTNNADEMKRVLSSDFQIKTTDGALYMWSGDNGEDPSSLGPGASASWRVYFDVPQGKTPNQIIFDDVVCCNL